MTVKDNYNTENQHENQLDLFNLFKNYSRTILEAFVQSRLSYNFEADKVS